MLIKLTIVSVQQNESIEAFYGGYGNLTLEEIYRLILVRQSFLEQLLILISLTGYLTRKNSGFIIANVFPYFVLGYGLFHLFDSTKIFAGYHIGQVTFALSVTLLTNTRTAINTFGLQFRTKQQLRANIISLAIALTLVLTLLVWIKLNE